MYSVLNVTADVEHMEPMGSKPKFWFEHPSLGACLFKIARPSTGEDWSEKLAERFASFLGIRMPDMSLQSGETSEESLLLD